MSEETKQAVEETVSEDTKKEDKPKIELSKKMEEVIDIVKNMTVLELSNLVKALEDEFGVSAAAPVMAVAGTAPAAGETTEEAKDSFDVILTAAGDKKIQVIKELRTITSLGLKEAKDLVDSAPKAVKEGVAAKEAEEIKAKLEAVGASVELK